MLSTLIKKQFMELSTLFSMGKRRSKRGSAGGFVLTLALYVLIAFSLGASMILLAWQLSDELVGKGEDWKYFILLDILGLMLATLITMFNADLTLFRAKDNETLLSMPIPPGYILLARMTPLYIISLIFICSVLVPEIAVYMISNGMSVPLIILNVLLTLGLAFLALGLSSVLGWLISLLNARLKGNSVVTTIISLGFLGAYFFIYFQMNKFSAALVSHSSAIGDTIRKVLPPLYYLGQAHTGSISGVIIGFLTIAVIFGVIYFVLSRTFRGVVINASKGTSVKISRGVLRTGTQAQTLLKKEIKRFTASTSYMMNCGLGSVFMLVLAILAVIKKDDLLYILDSLTGAIGPASKYMAGILALVIFLLVSTCYYTMPSISLEGKSIWILQSVPVDPMKVFMSKIKMEYILCAPGVLILSTVVAILTGMSFLSWAAAVIAGLAYTTFTAFYGLWINLKRPNLDWTNEAYPIKQGLNPLFCLFGEWLLTLILGGVFLLVGWFIPVEAYLMIVTATLLAVSYAIYRWLQTRGRAIFCYLQ